MDMTTAMVRRCDICGKREGVELTENDFTTKLSLKLKDYNGDPILVSCGIHTKPLGSSKKADKHLIDDVIRDYNPIAYVDESIENSTNLIGNKLLKAHVKLIIDKSDSLYKHDSDICKCCFRGMMRLIKEYAKFEETVEF